MYFFILLFIHIQYDPNFTIEDSRTWQDSCTLSHSNNRSVLISGDFLYHLWSSLFWHLFIIYDNYGIMIWIHIIIIIRRKTENLQCIYIYIYICIFSYTCVYTLVKNIYLIIFCYQLFHIHCFSTIFSGSLSDNYCHLL